MTRHFGRFTIWVLWPHCRILGSSIIGLGLERRQIDCRSAANALNQDHWQQVIITGPAFASNRPI